MHVGTSTIHKIRDCVFFLEKTERRTEKGDMSVLEKVSDFLDRAERTEYCAYVQSAHLH